MKMDHDATLAHFGGLPPSVFSITPDDSLRPPIPPHNPNWLDIEEDFYLAHEGHLLPFQGGDIPQHGESALQPSFNANQRIGNKSLGPNLERAWQTQNREPNEGTPIFEWLREYRINKVLDTHDPFPTAGEFFGLDRETNPTFNLLLEAENNHVLDVCRPGTATANDSLLLEGDFIEATQQPCQSRSRLHPDVKELLENYFHEEVYPNPSERMSIAAELKMSFKQVTNWFRNKRHRIPPQGMSITSTELGNI